MEVNSQLRRRLLCLFRRPEGEVPAAWLSASAEQQRDHIGFRIKIAIETAAAVAAAIAAKQASAVRYSLTIVLTGARSGTQHIIVQAASRAWGTVVTAQGALEATHSA
jgi:hypothetical protein